MDAKVVQAIIIMILSFSMRQDNKTKHLIRTCLPFPKEEIK